MRNMLNRRDFLRYAGFGTMGVAAAAALASCSSGNDTGSAGSTDSGKQNIQEAYKKSEIEISQEGTTAIGSENIDTARKTTDGTGSDPSTRYPLFRVGVTSSPTNLQPWSNSNDAMACREGLTDYTAGNFEPRMASSWEHDGNTSTTFHLRKDITDWEGNAITADDVMFSYQQYIDQAHTIKFQAYKSMEKVDDYTIKFYWNETERTALNSLEKIIASMYVFSEKAYNSHNFAADAVYTGPYKITKYIDGNIETIEARDDYYVTDDSELKPVNYRNVQTIEFQVIAEATQHAIALQNGSIDFSSSVTSENLPYFQEGGQYANDYQVIVLNAGNGYFVNANYTEGHFTADLNFRLACYYALDNTTIAKAVGQAEAAVANCPKRMSDHIDSWYTQETYLNTYNLDLAKEYLAKTSYKGETITIIASSNEIFKNTLQTIQMLWLQLGVNTDLQLLDQTVLNTTRADFNAWDFFVNWYGGSVWVSAMNTQFELGRIASNPEMTQNGLVDPKANELFATAKLESGHTDENVDAFYQYIIDNALLYTMFGTMNNMVCSNIIAAPTLLDGFQPIYNAFIFYLDD